MYTTTTRRKLNKEPVGVVIPCATAKGRLGHPYEIQLSGKNSLLDDTIAKVRAHYTRADIIVVVPPSAPKRLFPNEARLVVNDRAEDTGVARSIGLGLMANNQPSALIVYGNTFFSAKVFEAYTPHQTYTVVPTLPQSGSFATEIGVTSVDGQITTMSHGLTNRWIEIIMMGGYVLTEFTKRCLAESNRMALTSEVLNGIIGTYKFVEQGLSPEIVAKPINSAKDLKEVGPC